MERPHWADTVIAVFTILIFLTYITSDYFLWKQSKLAEQTLREVRSGGADTHELAVQAKNQADAAASLAGATKIQADRTKDIAERLLLQATATNKLAIATANQAASASESVSQARIANQQAERSFIAQTRPWIAVSDVRFSWGKNQRFIGFLKLPSLILRNYGASPAHRVGVFFEVINTLKPYAQWPALSDQACLNAEQMSRGGQISSTETIFPDIKGLESAYQVNFAQYTQWADSYVIGCIAYQSAASKSCTILASCMTFLR